MPASPRSSVSVETLTRLSYTFPDHLRVNRDLLIERAVFGDGEIIVFEEIENIFEARIRNPEVVLVIKIVFGEQSAVEVGRRG